MQRIVPVLLVCAVVAGWAVVAPPPSLAEDPSPVNTLRHFLRALKNGDFDAAMDLYDPSPFDGTKLWSAVEENLADLVIFDEESTPEERVRLSFTMPVEKRPLPEAEKAYADLGLPEAYDWPHLVTELFLEDEEGELVGSVKRVYVMVPAGDGWAVGYWYNNYADTDDD
jgi:hypothetical protein